MESFAKFDCKKTKKRCLCAMIDGNCEIVVFNQNARCPLLTESDYARYNNKRNIEMALDWASQDFNLISQFNSAWKRAHPRRFEPANPLLVMSD